MEDKRTDSVEEGKEGRRYSNTNQRGRGRDYNQPREKSYHSNSGNRNRNFDNRDTTADDRWGHDGFDQQHNEEQSQPRNRRSNYKNNDRDRQQHSVATSNSTEPTYTRHVIIEPEESDPYDAEKRRVFVADNSIKISTEAISGFNRPQRRDQGFYPPKGKFSNKDEPQEQPREDNTRRQVRYQRDEQEEQEEREQYRRPREDQPRRNVQYERQSDQPRRNQEDQPRRYQDDQPRRYQDDQPRRYQNDQPRRYQDNQSNRQQEDQPRRNQEDRRQYNNDQPRRRYQDDQPRRYQDNQSTRQQEDRRQNNDRTQSRYQQQQEEDYRENSSRNPRYQNDSQRRNQRLSYNDNNTDNATQRKSEVPAKVEETKKKNVSASKSEEKPAESNVNKENAADDTTRVLILDIEVEPGKVESLEVFEGNDPAKLSSDFCTKFNMDSKYIEYIADQIRTNLSKLNQST